MRPAPPPPPMLIMPPTSAADATGNLDDDDDDDDVSSPAPPLLPSPSLFTGMLDPSSVALPPLTLTLLPTLPPALPPAPRMLDAPVSDGGCGGCGAAGAESGGSVRAHLARADRTLPPEERTPPLARQVTTASKKSALSSGSPESPKAAWGKGLWMD